MSRKLWLIIIIKLFIMFAVLRVFFFPNYVKEQAKERNIDRQEVVGDELLDRRAPGSTSPSTAGK